jgi:hypothetical protein
MAKLRDYTNGISYGTTDARMRANRYLDFHYQIIHKNYDNFNRMRDIARQQLGCEPVWFYKNKIDRSGLGRRHGSHYDDKNKFDRSRHKLYFRTIEDMEMVLALYTLTHGVD